VENHEHHDCGYQSHEQGQSYLWKTPLHVNSGRIPIQYGQNTPHRITDGSPDDHGAQKGRRTEAKYAGAQNKDLERGWRRQNARYNHCQDAEALEESLGSLNVFGREPAMQERTASFSANGVQKHAACHGPDHCHEDIVSHSLPRLAGGKHHDEEVVPFRD